MGQNLLKPGNPQAYKFIPASVFNNGDLLMWDPTNGQQRLTAETDYASFLGVAAGQNPVSSGIDGAAVVEGLTQRSTVQRVGIFSFLTTPAESYTHAVALKWAGDQQIALDSSAGHIIGYANIPGGETITGAAGVRIQVEIWSRLGSPTILSA